jgi:hypothetical protein
MIKKGMKLSTQLFTENEGIQVGFHLLVRKESKRKGHKEEEDAKTAKKKFLCGLCRLLTLRASSV